MKKIIFLTLVAALAMAFVGCSAMNENNSNKAVVVNNNMSANSMTSANMMMNSNAMTTNSNAMMNSNMSNKSLTREEYDKDKDKYSAEAKSAGRSVGTGVNDGWLWTKTRADLLATNDLRESTINVDVNNAVVTLTGTVASKEQETKAVQVAQGVSGVTSVKNMLKVQPNDSLTNQTVGTGNSNAKMMNANHK